VALFNHNGSALSTASGAAASKIGAGAKAIDDRVTQLERDRAELLATLQAFIPPGPVANTVAQALGTVVKDSKTATSDASKAAAGAATTAAAASTDAGKAAVMATKAETTAGAAATTAVTAASQATTASTVAADAQKAVVEIDARVKEVERTLDPETVKLIRRTDWTGLSEKVKGGMTRDELLAEIKQRLTDAGATPAQIKALEDKTNGLNTAQILGLLAAVGAGGTGGTIASRTMSKSGKRLDKHDAELAGMRDKHDAEVKDLRATHAGEINDVYYKYDGEIKTLQSQIAQLQACCAAAKAKG
jgi:hypothetical protein